jgi:hypothetical protein
MTKSAVLGTAQAGFQRGLPDRQTPRPAQSGSADSLFGFVIGSC